MNCRTHRSSTLRTHIAAPGLARGHACLRVGDSSCERSRRRYPVHPGGAAGAQLPDAEHRGNRSRDRHVAHERSRYQVDGSRSRSPNLPKLLTRRARRAFTSRLRSRPRSRQVGLHVARDWIVCWRGLGLAHRADAPCNWNHWKKSLKRPQIRRDYPLNLSISLSGGKETNQDSLSNGE